MKVSSWCCGAMLATWLAGSAFGQTAPATQPSGAGGVAEAATASASQPTTVAATSQPGTAMPEMQYEDLVLLVETARQSFREAVLGKPNRGAGFRPLALRGVEAIIHVTL